MGFAAVGLMSLSLCGWLSPAGDGKADPAAEAIRREVEARKKQQDDAFARIRALPAAQVQVVRGIIRDDLITLLERDENGDDEGEDGEKPIRRRDVVSRDTFDRVLFGSTGDIDSARLYLERILDGKVRAVDQVRRLSPAQKRRLMLAGRGDIKRLFDRIEEERKNFERLRGDVERCVAFLRELRPLQYQLRSGSFEFDSIFAKTLKKMLDQGELARRGP